MTCLKNMELPLQITMASLQSKVNTIGGTYVSNQETNKHVLPITITNSYFQSFFPSIRFTVDFLLQHAFCCAKSKSRRTFKIYQTAPTYLTHTPHGHLITVKLHRDGPRSFQRKETSSKVSLGRKGRWISQE